MTVGDSRAPNDAEIINRGGRDYFNHSGVYKNPYPSETPGYNDYERGWMQSLKRDDRKPIAQAFKPAPVTQTAPKSEVNHYALMKGRSSPRK